MQEELQNVLAQISLKQYLTCIQWWNWRDVLSRWTRWSRSYDLPVRCRNTELCVHKRRENLKNYFQEEMYMTWRGTKLVEPESSKCSPLQEKNEERRHYVKKLLVHVEVLARDHWQSHDNIPVKAWMKKSRDKWCFLNELAISRRLLKSMKAEQSYSSCSMSQSHTVSTFWEWQNIFSHTHRRWS